MKKTIIAILLLLTGCSPTSFISSSMSTLSTSSQERGLGGYVNDGEIKTRLNLLLFKRDYEMYQQVNVNVYEGRVLLTGNVPTQKIKDDVVKLSWQVPGVKSVMDETVVMPMRTFKQYIKDKWITTRLESAMLFDQAIKSRNYEVHTQNGVIYLTGLAQSDAELQTILQKARSINGVVRVVAYVRTVSAIEQRRNELMKNSWDRTHSNTSSKILYREKLKAKAAPDTKASPTTKATENSTADRKPTPPKDVLSKEEKNA